MGAEGKVTREKFGKKGQTTIFVIIAIAIVAAIVIFFAFRGQILSDSVPREFSPIYDLYLECIQQETENGLSLLGTQGGRIDVGSFVPGSEYAPFSSHLNFLGIPVPYWYHIAGNNLIKENVPTISDMETELENFLEERVNDCDFEEYYQQGFYVDTGEPEVEITITESSVEVNVNSEVVSSIEDRVARKSDHEVIVESKLGKYYDIATQVYEKESREAFLENYAVDVLRYYAPVDGVEVQCSPVIWETREVVNSLLEGMQANIGAVKLEGDYYDLAREENDYYVVDMNVDEPVNFLYSSDWPSKIEVTPADQELMIAEPVGNQEGLGVMGFCYVPYHFVYDVSFPVMVQIGEGLDIFQFPLTVIIDNNLPREAELLELNEEPEYDVCAFKENEATIHTYDRNLNPIEADIDYRCIEDVCQLGSTEILGADAVLNTDIPVCVNGQIIAKAEGFADAYVQFSSNSEEIADVILERVYDVDLELFMGGLEISDQTAVIHFIGEDYSDSAVFPSDREVTLKEGIYDVSVFVYGDSSLTIPATTKTQCYEAARGGVLGLLGGTKEECVNIDIPAVEVDYALSGGGKVNTYLLESELSSGMLRVDVSELPTPNSLEQLQYNYEVFNSLGVQLSFV